MPSVARQHAEREQIVHGDTVTIAVTNRLSEDTSIHWHGIRTPADMDGVPGSHVVGSRDQTARPRDVVQLDRVDYVDDPEKGIDEVLARSAFSAQLGDILKS